MNEQIDSAIKRTRAYWFVDGFTEMAMGGLFVILSVALLLSGSASPSTFPSWFLSMVGKFSIVKLVSVLIAILILWWLKDHFTYPRTGYVRGTRITTSQILAIIRNFILFLLLPIFGLFAASLLITSTSRVIAAIPVWFPIGLGILWAVFFVLSGEWMGLRRFRLMGILILLAGVTIGVWQFAIGLPVFPVNVQPEISQPAVLESITRALTSLSYLVLITGLILIFSGLITFLGYRRENPTPYTEDV